MNQRIALSPLAGLLAATALFALLPSAALAQPAKPISNDEAAPLSETVVIERVTTALDKSMEYLRSKQRPDGGWWENNAINGIALMSFMGRGHTPGRGPYKDVLEKGKKYILAHCKRDEKANTAFVAFGTMYEHGMGTLSLAEMYGMDPDPELESTLRGAVNLILQSQSPAGGWRYSPTPTDQDMSVSVMQIVAMRAANNAEIPVPQAAIDKAVQYVRSCAAPNGGYGYQGPSAGPQTSAAGLLSLQLLGHVDDPGIPKTLDYLANLKIDWTNQTGVNYFYYFHYYAMQGNYQAGGKYWNNWHPQIRELLLKHQNADGSWDCPPGTAEAAEGTVGPNKVYWTALASLVLEVYMHYLPAYQR
ncbi:MAG: prenyltransferase/squalene oxidase repeat-containing protein [Pirellulales bacterium]